MASSINFPNRGRYSGPINAYRQSGAAAVVRKYRDTKQDNKVVALKTYRSDTTVNSVTLIRELYILRRLKHPCLVELQNAFSSSEERPLRYPWFLNSMNLIYESMDMDLKSYLEIMVNRLSLDDIKEILHQLLCGIHFCHSANVMHRDIKPANILVNIPKDISNSSSAAALASSSAAAPSSSSSSLSSLSSLSSTLDHPGGGGSTLFSRPYRCTAKHCDFGLARVLEPVLFPSHSSTDRAMQTGVRQSASLDNLVLLEMDSEGLLPSSPYNHDDCLDFDEEDVNNSNNNNMNNNNNISVGNSSSDGSTVFDSITTIPGDTRSDATPLNQNSIAFYEADNLQNLQHQPSVHVVTRYYRAPEVILVQTYTSAIDVWSIGCTLAELFAVHNERSARGKRRDNILFPGENGPSPAGSLLTEHFALHSGSRDQLTVIMEKLGSKAVKAALPSYSVQAQALITKRLDQERHITEDGVSLTALYPTIPQEGVDLLSRLLDFNPSTRIRAEDALMHPFFTTRCGVGSEFIKDASLETISEHPLSADDASSIESQHRALQGAILAEIDYWEQTHRGGMGGTGGGGSSNSNSNSNSNSSLHPT